MKKAIKIACLFFIFLLAISIASVMAWPVVLISIFSMLYFSRIEPDKKFLEYAKYGLLIGVVGLIMSYFHVDILTGFNRTNEEDSATEQEYKEKVVVEDNNSKESYRAKEVDYTNFILDSSDDMSEAYGDFKKQMDTMEYNELWVKKTSIIVERIGEVTEQIIEYDPSDVPSGYSQIHDNYIMGALKHNEAMKLFAEGFNNFDQELMGESAEKMSEGNEFVEEAMRLLNQKQ